MTLKVLSYEQIIEDINPDVLRNGSIFGAISEDAINYLLQAGELYAAEHGNSIFEYGDKGDNFYIVCRGSVDFYKQHDNTCIKTRTAGFGEELGFVAMIALHAHTGYAVASESSIVLKVSSAVFHELHNQFPYDFGIMTLNLARDMARTIRKLSNTLIENALDY